MDVSGAVESWLVLKTLQNVESFKHRRTLAPESGLVDAIALERGRGRLLRLQLERRHVFVAQEPTVGLAESVDLARDFAAVEIVAHCIDGGLARCAASGRLPFRL